MALNFGQIPLKANDPFGHGMKSIGDMFKEIHARQQAADKLAELAKAHKAQFGIQRQTENRLQQLLGPQLQEYADKHMQQQPDYKAQQALAVIQAIKSGRLGGQGNMPSMGGAGGRQAGGQAGGAPQQPPMGGEQNSQQAINDPNTGILSGGNRDRSPDEMVNNAQQGGQNTSLIPPIPNLSEHSNNGLDLNDPDVQLGLAVAGIHMPVPHESPEARQQRDIETARAKEKIKEEQETAKENRKVTQTIEDTAKPVLEAARHLEAIEKLLVAHPNATGKIANYAAGNSLLSRFADAATIKAINAHAVPLQGKLAKELSARGGYGVANIAEGAKPSGKESFEGNVGLVQANKESILDSLNMMKDDYERRNPGRKFPYKIPEFLNKNPFDKHPQQRVTLIHPDGTEEKMTRAEAEKRIKEKK